MRGWLYEVIMASIQAHQDYLTMLKRDVQAAWIKACEADGIEPGAKFVAFSNTAEAAAYNELMGMFLRARQKFHNQVSRNMVRRVQHARNKRLSKLVFSAY